jgi:hypothetical protein
MANFFTAAKATATSTTYHLGNGLFGSGVNTGGVATLGSGTPGKVSASGSISGAVANVGGRIKAQPKAPRMTGIAPKAHPVFGGTKTVTAPRARPIGRKLTRVPVAGR